MSTIEERVKKIVIEQLGVKEEDVTTSASFVDDLGAAKPSEWTEEINYRLVNHRYEHMLPTIFTSNVPARELGSPAPRAHGTTERA